MQTCRDVGLAEGRTLVHIVRVRLTGGDVKREHRFAQRRVPRTTNPRATDDFPDGGLWHVSCSKKGTRPGDHMKPEHDLSNQEKSDETDGSTNADRCRVAGRADRRVSEHDGQVGRPERR
jgi:hypothetical protein